MSISIRRATIEDAPSIAEVFERAYEEDVSLGQIELCFEQKNRQTWVVLADKRVVAFTDTFITTALDGKQRRELDLLAVHPDYHGQGIGKLLINQVTDAKPSVDFTRALVASGNTRMERAMTSRDYSVLPDTYALFIASHLAEETLKPENAHPIPVTTFAYSGVWLEGKISEQSITAALSSKREGDIVGAVIPVSDDSAIQTLKSANFDFIKHFQWWHKASV